MVAGEAESWAAVLSGPFGGLVAVLAVGAAIVTGRLRLARELEAQAAAHAATVAALTAERDEFRRRWEKWEALSLQLMQASSRAVSLAASSTAAAAPVPARDGAG